MKRFKFYLTIVAVLLTGMTFVACDDDNDEPFDPTEMHDDGMTAYRAFVLSEGSYGQNNSHLVYVNPNTYVSSTTDVYETVNGQKIGDTAQGMVTYNGDIYYVVNGSKYVVRLNSSGKEMARYSFTDEQGQPRYLTIHNGKVYVTAYGGCIVRLDAETLSYEAQVATDANPEQIVYLDGYLYAVCSGYGKGNTMMKVDANKFSSPESITVMSNPQYLCEAGGSLFIMAADESWTMYVSEYNPKTGETTRIANATKMAAVNDKLYLANSTSSDWVTYTTTYSVYDPATKSTASWNLSTSSAPEAFTKGVIYMISYNDIADEFYLGATDYSTNGTICAFDKQGSYLGSFSAGGVNPNSMVFLNVE